MGIFDFFKRKTDIEEYYEKREKEKRRERYRNFNNYTEIPRKNTKLYERNETDKISRSFKKKRLIAFLIITGIAIFLLNTFRYESYYDEDYDFVLMEQGKTYKLNDNIYMGKDRLTGRVYINADELWKIFKIEEFEYEAVRDKDFKWEYFDEEPVRITISSNKKKVTLNYISKRKILYADQKIFSVWSCPDITDINNCRIQKRYGVSYNELKKEFYMILDIKADKKKKIIYFIKNDNGSWKKANKEMEKMRKKKAAEEKKYNNYIRLYDRLEFYSEDFDYYFSGAGREEKFIDKYKRIRFRLDQNYINKLENTVKEEPEIPEADIAANNLVLVLNELLILFDKTKSYYQSAEYLNDGYEGAQKLHTEILEGSERYKASVCDFRRILEKNGMQAETESWYNNVEEYKIDCY